MQLDYWPFKGCEDDFLLNTQTHKDVVNMSNFIIPTFYDYTEPWALHKDSVENNTFAQIQLQSNLFPRKKDRVIFFHGLNSECKKGTKYIRKALENIQQKYTNDVEVIIDGYMPQEKYLALMKKADVVIDQCSI